MSLRPFTPGGGVGFRQNLVPPGAHGTVTQKNESLAHKQYAKHPLIHCVYNNLSSNVPQF